MVSIYLILVSIVVVSVSGLPACLLSPKSERGQRLSTVLLSGGSLVGLFGLVLFFRSDAGGSVLRLPWALPAGEFHVALDPLSAFFLAPVFLVPALGSVYALGYWKQGDHQDNGRKLGLFYGLLAGAMALVLVSRDSILFLVAWEVMALAAWFASTAEEHDPDVRRAGWVYLIATHVGTLFLFAMFALWYRETGSTALEPAKAVVSSGVLFVFALIGFGFKAGFMPLHVWLPGAHANAPSHVSAVMSGVMLKIGIYGILRMTFLLGTGPLWWGGLLLAVGAATAVLGIAFAVGQSDIKRLLAYSSIENIGIIGMGIGLAFLGRASGRFDLVALGLGGALLHVWNHGLFKPLLFYNAGAIIHATGTRRIDRLGGLGKSMPVTMALFVAGAVAICGLPTQNGFVSEWLLYLGLFRSLDAGSAQGLPLAAGAAVALAMTGALAVACFVKVAGTVFLGMNRSAAADHAHDPVSSMTAPMAVLLLGCLMIGLAPMAVMPVVERAAWFWAGATPQSVGPGSAALEAVAPLSSVSLSALAVIVLSALILFVLKLLPRVRKPGQAGTWDCGYAGPTRRMQYTGSSFGSTIVGLFSFVLRPGTKKVSVEGAFPAQTDFRAKVPDTVLERFARPVFAFFLRLLPRIRVVQQGRTHMYVLYVVIITIVLLVFGGLGVRL